MMNDQDKSKELSNELLNLQQENSSLRASRDKIIANLKFETLLTEIAALLVQVQYQQLSQDITNSQRMVCEFLGLDLSSIYQPVSESSPTLQRTNVYHRSDKLFMPEMLIVSDYFPWCEKELLSGKIQVVHSMNELPAEAALDRESWNNFGVKSSVIFPMIAANGEFLGMISFDAMKEEFYFPDELVNDLKLVAQLFANSIKRINTEKILSESERMLLESQKIAGLGSYVLDIGTGRIRTSAALDELFGIDENYDHSVEGWLKLIHPEDREKMKGCIKDHVREERKNAGTEFRLIRDKDKSTQWFRALSILESDSKGNPVKLHGTIQHITEHKLAEEKLKESEEKYKALFESNSDGITIFALRENELPNQILDMNQNSYKMLGFTKEEMLLLSPAQLERNVSREIIERRAADINTKGFSSFETILQHKRGFDVPVEIKVLVISYNNQHALMNIVRDITERKLIENQLLIAKEKAEESDRLKSAFLANMSHEIRTPMNGILGFAELLKQPDLTGEEQEKYIRIIEKSGNRMLNILAEIMDISRIESGLIETDIRNININKQVEFVYDLLKPDAESKSITLSYKYGLSFNESIFQTDGEKLYGILSNLVKNAIKYTDKGSVEFGYEKLEKEGQAFLQFFIKDTGIGIPKNRQEEIFARFMQADIADIQARQGAGLGLSIAKAFVELLGGKIWVVSEPGKGSSFYFTLPYPKEPEIKTNARTADPEKRVENPVIPGVPELKILIAEDDETSEMLISIVVKDFCKQIFKAKNGIEAIEICRNNPDLDLILMDIQMPVMNGYKATHRIRQFNNNIIIIAQTAFGQAGDRETALESGCNDYITKPIKRTELLALIQKYFRK